MKKFFIILCLFIFLSNLYSKEKIAVLNFKSIGVDNNYSDAITEILITSIASYNKYELIERAQINKIFDELELTLNDDFEEDTVIRIGKMAKARTIIVGSVSKLGKKIIINCRGIEVESGKTIFGENISVDNEDYIFEAVKTIAAKICGEKYVYTINNKDDSDPPEHDYKTFDSFDTLNSKIWNKIDLDKEHESKYIDSVMRITGKYREGRLSAYSDLISQDFRPQSVTVEVSFRAPSSCVQTVQLMVSNNNWFSGSGISVFVNLDKEYYKFAWNIGSDWYNNKDNIIYTYGDEDKKFHTMKLVYDIENKTAFAYIDDNFLDKTENFKFNLEDKININIKIKESRNKLKDDFLVELDEFKTTVNFK